jgi:probable HAF family extracellular repeat protein
VNTPHPTLARARSAACLLALLLLAGLGLRPAAAQSSYYIEDLGTLGGLFSLGLAINGAGQVVGSARLANGQSHAFRWSDGVMEDLGAIGGAGDYSGAFAINGAGQVVGIAGNNETPMKAYAWPGVQSLGTLGGMQSWAYGINAAGQAVGCANPPDEAVAEVPEHAFLYTPSLGMLDLNAGLDPTLGWELKSARAINDTGQIVGWGLHNGQRRAFRWTKGAVEDLGELGGNDSDAAAINAAGQVAGVARAANGLEHAFLWTAPGAGGRGGGRPADTGGMKDLGTLGGTYSDAAGINAAGQVVGSAALPMRFGNFPNAFLYTPGTGLVNLNDRIHPAFRAGWELRRANGINDAGQIVGYGQHDGRDRAFRLTPLVGLGGRLAPSPARVTLPPIAAGGTQRQDVVLNNVGTGTVLGRVGTLTGAFAVDAGRSSDFLLAPGQQKVVTVIFAPTRGVGIFTATLPVTIFYPTAATVNVPVSGIIQ